MAELIDEEFDPFGVASINPPFFVRKIDKRRHWKVDDAAFREECVRTAANQVFRKDEKGKVSVFLVETAVDLQRTSIGLNSGRSSLSEKLFILCITPDELSAAGLEGSASPGDTSCDFANRLHYDISHDEQGILKLVDSLIDAKRTVSKLNKTKMGHAAEHALSIGCRATKTDLPECVCATEAL